MKSFAQENKNTSLKLDVIWRFDVIWRQVTVLCCILIRLKMASTSASEISHCKKYLMYYFLVMIVKGKLLSGGGWKNEEVTGKTPFFVIGPFCTSHFVCFWQCSFVELLILVLSTKRRYSNSLKKHFLFYRKFVPTLKILKTF